MPASSCTGSSALFSWQLWSPWKIRGFCQEAMTLKKLVFDEQMQGFSPMTPGPCYLFPPISATVSLHHLHRLCVTCAQGMGRMWWLQVGSLEGQPDRERFTQCWPGSCPRAVLLCVYYHKLSQYRRIKTPLFPLQLGQDTSSRLKAPGGLRPTTLPFPGQPRGVS